MRAGTHANTAQAANPPLLARQLHFVTASEQPRLPAATTANEATAATAACRAIAALATSHELSHELLDTPTAEGEQQPQVSCRLTCQQLLRGLQYLSRRCRHGTHRPARRRRRRRRRCRCSSSSCRPRRRRSPGADRCMYRVHVRLRRAE